MWAGMQTAVEAEKQGLREKLHRDFPEVTPKIIEAEGDVWRAVSNAIEKYEIDLVVLGTRGRTGLEKVLLGSKAEEILRRVQCPVLTVGPDSRAKLEIRGKIASILYATHFGPASLKASRIAVSLAEEYQAKLTVLTVRPPDRNELSPALKRKSEKLAKRNFADSSPKTPNYGAPRALWLSTETTPRKKSWNARAEKRRTFHPRRAQTGRRGWSGYSPSNYHDSSGRCARELPGVDDSRLASV